MFNVLADRGQAKRRGRRVEHRRRARRHGRKRRSVEIECQKKFRGLVRKHSLGQALEREGGIREKIPLPGVTREIFLTLWRSPLHPARESFASLERMVNPTPSLPLHSPSLSSSQW